MREKGYSPTSCQEREKKRRRRGKCPPSYRDRGQTPAFCFYRLPTPCFPRPPRQLSQPNIRLLRDEKEKHIIAKYKLPATLHSVHRSPRIDNMYNRRPKKKIQKMKTSPAPISPSGALPICRHSIPMSYIVAQFDDALSVSDSRLR